MRAQYPAEMTIVLQHQFWDLIVGDDAFEVGLSFGGVPELIAVPFEAITAFYDPAVQFGFQFETFESQTAEEPAAASGQPEPAPAAPHLPAAKPAEVLPVPGPAVAEKSAPETAPLDGGAQVLRLDRFRKK
jgi:hypothetical protein